ncbi:unnamed protein product [Mytilus edulis]|uniref:C2H2-type domain-containing protein n=1 Tax=Mytilus edulis TaxID=6550 RepID=A0A8S3PS18_MYTED|nr:unnamed protein product [Mytilus edulis]
MDAKFSCEFCDLSFTKKRNKKRHEKEIHGQRKKNSHCDICNSSFGRKSDLKRHVRKFHSEENKGHQEVPAEKKELLVKIPEYSDISDDDIEWDDNNNITSDYNFPDRNANGDATTYEADNYVTVEKENFNLDGFCVVDDDFLDITEEEFTDMKSNLVVEEDVKTEFHSPGKGVLLHILFHEHPVGAQEIRREIRQEIRPWIRRGLVYKGREYRYERAGERTFVELRITSSATKSDYSQCYYLDLSEYTSLMDIVVQ